MKKFNFKSQYHYNQFDKMTKIYRLENFLETFTRSVATVIGSSTIFFMDNNCIEKKFE